ncbi:MAG: carbohydrate binding domain-containing protein [Gloeobacteraceae cyanobacterium ES-bin-144]|nr:carbohydrate binding domain-containing protein [Verrucomicrobiales bacterium]
MDSHWVISERMKQLFIGWVSLMLVLGSHADIISNNSFESGLTGWRPLWMRDADAGTLMLDTAETHSGKQSALIEYRGKNDWSLEPQVRLKVQTGEIFELETWLKLENPNSKTTLCVAIYDSKGKAIEWSYGTRSPRDIAGWQQLKTRFVVPNGVTEIQPRLLGYGTIKVWVDDFMLEKKGSVDSMRPANLPDAITIRNAMLEVSLNTKTAALTVIDRRNGRTTEQIPQASNLLLTAAMATDDLIDFKLANLASGMVLTCILKLDVKLPEFTFEISAHGDLTDSLPYPHPFASQSGEYLVIPMNEGISYPVEDKSIEPFSLVAYGGHGICMAFWGVTDGSSGHSVIIETPDDAAIHILRPNNLLAVAPQWEPQRSSFGYTRCLRYVFFNQGGHVAIAKRYRAHAQKTGLFKTLEQKRRENPNVDLLIGAVNVWSWEQDAESLVKEMQSSGIDRILWSAAAPPEQIKAMNELGALTSRYDIYQDSMNPQNFPKLRYKHADWTSEGWPQDIIRKASGEWLHGWKIEGKNNDEYDCGVLCDKRAPDYARKRIPAELITHPYRSRFIDTTTASPWRECYHPDHPMTRTESKLWKMKLLDYISRDNKLVTGCETGHDAAVPFLHYFEGMMSLGPYRVPDSGRDMQRIWTEIPEPVEKFQLGHAYRLPLWELVYHECVVSQWYWGDYNNKLPALWDKRDLFNVLYSTPPMFMFDRRLWEKNKERFAQSYRNTCPFVRSLGYSEMTDHRFLTADRSVQQTIFSNKTIITVNFGSSAFKLPDGTMLEAMGFLVK